MFFNEGQNMGAPGANGITVFAAAVYAVSVKMAPEFIEKVGAALAIGELCERESASNRVYKAA
ncbi:hypothetical protein EMIT0P265_60006 [Pseudomonas zeae]